MRITPPSTYQEDPTGAARRHEALVAYLHSVPDVLRSGPTLQSNYLDTTVCSPAGASYCASFMRTGADLGGPGYDATEESYTFTIAAAQFGNSFDAMAIPSSPNSLALSFSYSEDGKSIGGDGMTMDFVYLTPALQQSIEETEPVDYFDLDGAPANLTTGNSLELSDRPTYTLTAPGGPGGEQSQTTVALTADSRTVLGSLDEYIISASSLKSYALSRESQLLSEVTEEIEGNHVTETASCQSSSNGTPPICTYVPLPPAQRGPVIAAARQQIAQQDAFISAHYEAMYATVSAAIGWQKCRACWS